MSNIVTHLHRLEQVVRLSVYFCLFLLQEVGLCVCLCVLVTLK